MTEKYIEIEKKIIIFVFMEMKEKKCKVCDRIKPFDSFPKNNKMRDGILNTCKICYSLRARQLRELRPVKAPKYKTKGTRHYLSMNGLTKSDWCKMYDFMARLGYDLEKNIHDQFCEKFGLPPKKEPSREILKYYPHDCE